MKATIFLISCSLFGFVNLNGQDPARFESEVAAFRSQPFAGDPGDVIVFTGSSSIRMWRDVDSDFPERKILNRGFGGSQMSDLLYYLDDLVLRYQPRKVFIYEGDNDIAAGKKAKRILRDAKKIRKRIKKELPGTAVYFIAAKPSIARWEMRDRYLDLNGRLENYASKNADTFFIDVWAPMLAADGTVMKTIFIDDGLHMNRKGYDIWKEAIAPSLR